METPKAFLSPTWASRRDRIRDRDGAVLGEHTGTYGFTVGQRKGLGLTVATPDRSPRYVLSLEPASKTVTVGPREALEVREISADRPQWCGPPVEDGAQMAFQYRAHGETVRGSVRVFGEVLVALLDAPAHGVAPGQTLALYDGTWVRGSATITSTA